ncbi:MAG: universal stress protein [Hyphomicrobium sp.]|nr:universal stress protein [Hyphomicrobium sp.]
MKKLLMATDLSARSDRALQRALALAHQLGATLEVIHIVSDTVPVSIAEQYQASARTTIEQLLASLPLAANVKPEIAIIRGHDYEEILYHAQETGAELIVLGITRHIAYELFRGTTAERIIRIGDLPVLLVKDPVARNYERVLVATDNSPAAQRALECAAAIAPDAEFHLLHTVHVPFTGFLGPESQAQIRQEQERNFRNAFEKGIRAQVEQLGNGGLRATFHIEEGGILSVIRDQAERLKADLLAIGSHGRFSLRHSIIGTVAGNLLSDPPVDVLATKAW